MPRNVTVTFEDGTSHVYQNAPDDLTPEQAQARAVKDFSKRVVHLDGGRPAAPQQPAVPEEGFFSRLAKEPGYLGAAAERGALGLGASLRGYQASGIAEILEARKQKLAEATPEQKADPKWMEARLREIKEDEEAYARRMAQGAEYSKRSQDILESQRTRPESRLMFGAGKPERGWGEAASEIGTALVKDPGSLVDLALTSGPQMLAMMATTLLARAAGAPTTGAALAGGLTSKEIEFGNEYAENRQEGMSHEDAWNAAQAKSGIVGALDAVSMKTAGKTLDALTDAVKAAKSGHKGAVRTALKETGKEVATQAGLGATGEALGSVAAGKEISPTGVLLEALGETVTAPGEAAVMRSRISRGLEGTKAEEKAEEKAGAKPKGKRSVEEAAIDALDQETVDKRAVEDANQKFEEAALEDQQQPPMGGTELEGTEQRTTGGAGVDVPVSQPPAGAPTVAETGRGGLDVAEGPTGEAPVGEGQPSGALTTEQVDNLFAAGITATQIESGVETVRYVRDGERNLQDVLLTPIARDHAAGLTSEEIAKKNKINPFFARMLQVGLGLVPNEKVKPAAAETPAAETPVKPGTVRVYHSGAAGDGGSGRWASTDKTYAANYRPNQPLYYADIPANDPRVNNPDYENQGVKQGFAFNFELTPQEAATLKEIKRETPVAETPAAETPAAETPAAETPAAETPTSTALATISKREPVEAPKGVLRSKYTFSDGSAYQIEKREDEFHLVGVPDENDSYLGKTRGEAERALNDDKNSGRLDQVVGRGKPGALQLQQKQSESLGLPSGATIEGEYSVVVEEAARRMLGRADEELSAAEVARLEKHYGASKGSQEYLDKLRADIVSFINNGAASVAFAIRNIIKKLAVVVLSVGVVFNQGSFLNDAKAVSIPVPQTATQLVQIIEKSKANFGQVEPPATVATVADWVVGDNNNQGKPFIVVDKPTAMAYAFDGSGRLEAVTPVLLGENATADVLPESALNKTVEQTSRAEKVTPAGRFDATVEKSSSYGTSLRFMELPNANLAMHRTYLGAPAERRQQRLDTPTPADNYVSYGCINVGAEFYNQHILKPFSGGGVMYITPMTQNLNDVFQGLATYSPTYTVVTETVNNPQSATDVAAHSEQGTTREKQGRGRSKSAKARRTLENVDPEEFSEVLGEERVAYEELRERTIEEYAQLRRQLGQVPKQVAEGKTGLDTQRLVTRLLQRARELRAAIHATKPRRDSAENFLARALKEYDAGNISEDVLAVVQALYKKAPDVLNGLILSVRKARSEGVAGDFSNFSRIVTLYKGTSGTDEPGTLRHEICHSLEQMMTADQRVAVIMAWQNALQRAVKKHIDKRHREYFSAVFDFLDNPNEANLRRAVAKLPSYDMYQFLTPSEYWAVNAESLLESELGSAWDRFKRTVRKLFEGLKKVFGFNNKYDVHKAFDQIMGGSKNRMGPDMLIDLALSAYGDILPRENIEATQGQDSTVLGLHPTVSQALRAGDLNGMLKAIANTTSGFSADLARRLAELNLPTVISTGTARARQLTRASIDLVSAPQQNRLFSYVQLTYPDLYNKYFQNYDAEANLERVYDGLNELKKVLPEVNRVSAEFKDVLQAYNDNIESIDPRTLGFYSPDFDEVNVDTDRKTGTSNYVLLHETTHAATEMLITRYETEPETLTAEQRAAAKKLTELYEYTKENYPGDPKTYGLRNIYEFVAEAFTNRGFQTKLKDMTYDLVRPVSVWSRFVKSILDLFGINTVAANVMMEANKLFSADRPRARKSIGPMFAKKQKNGPISGGWRTAYDHNTSLIKLFQDAIKGRMPLDTALKKFAPVIWNTSAYGARQAYFVLAPLRELAKDTKSKFPQLTGAIKLVEQMVAYRGQKMKIAEDIVKDWGKLQSERVQQSTLLGRVMLSATLQGQDPDTGNGSAALLQAWNNALSPEAQSIYRRVRDFYANSVREMILEMKARARANLANDPAALKKSLDNIDALFKGIKGPYFPLRRFGNFWFQVGTTDNNKEFYTLESMADRDFAANERLEELRNGTKAEKELAKTYDLGNSIGEIFDQNKDPTGVLGRVEDLIDSLTATNPADVKKELKDSVHQLMYVLLPQQSMKKMFINRKGIQGASADMLRVFSDSAVHSAYQQARFKYSQDFLNNLTNAKDYIGEAKTAKLITPEQRAVYDEFIAEVGKRSGVILSTEDKRFTARLAAAANQTTFLWMLTGPATAMLNIIGGTTFGVAGMGSEFGYAKTTALLTKNLAKYGASAPTRTIKPLMGARTMQQFLAVDFPSMVEGSNLSPLQSMFAKAFIDSSDINISVTNALFELTEQPSALYTGRANMVKKFASGLFHQAERLIREMVLMTSAELAYDKFLNEPIKDVNGIIQRDANGKPLMRTKDATGFSQQAFDDALEKARDIAGSALGDFSRAMKPRLLQSPGGSVVFSMKSFAITALFHLVRNTYLSLNRPFRSDEMADLRAALLNQKIAPAVVDQMIKEAQAELKASYSEARKRLAGVMGITFLFGGLQAQPFFSLLLPALVAMLKTDDDDDDEDDFFNAENWFRNYMEINLGGYLGEMAMKLGMEEKTAKKVGREMGEAISGGIPAAAGVALTERVSIDPKDLWYRSGRYSPDYRETVMETVIANAGPAAGLTMNMFEAAQLMEEGKYQRAFERALPAIVSNPLKAARLGKEGAVTNSGVTQVEEFTATELAMQALGFQPELLAQKQKSAMEATTVKMQIQDKRNGVLDRLYLERNSEKGYEYALQMMDEYNKRYSYYPIKPKDIADSFKRKAKAAAEAHGIGMVMPKKMRGRLEPMVEYAKDEDED